MNLQNIRHNISTLFLLCCSLGGSSAILAEDGVTKDAIYIGGALDLKDKSKGLGLNMKAGIEAAFKGELIKNRRIKYIALNDSYNPKKTVESINQLISKKVFLFAGNVGTPTAKVALPILEKNKIPAVGFFTGAGLLRTGNDSVINYRASYIQETAKVIKNALNKGMKANQICAYVQNDAYGMAGIEGIIRALKGVNKSKKTIATLKEIKTLTGENPERNNKGPVGVYKRNSDFARPGYKSLKAWEKSKNTQCKLVITVGSYTAITEFVAYSRYKKEPWIFSAVSFTGAENFKNALQKFDVNEGVIMTQVVPPLDSNIPLIKEARQKLGRDFGYVSLEGFIVGKLVLYGLKQIEGDLTRERFTQAIINSSFKIKQLDFDFMKDNQGSDLVELMVLEEGEWVSGIDKNILDI